MRHVAISALCVLVLACNKEEQQAGVKVAIHYTPSFKTGCFVVQAFDAAKLETELQRATVTDPSLGSPRAVAVLRKEGWGAKIRLVVTAHEQTCDGPQVDQKMVDLELGGAGVQTEQKVELVTPDEDGDGYVPTANGGTDCDDRTKDVTRRSYYRDADGDGVGTGAAVLGCTAPSGHVAMNGDCDDGAMAVRPGAQEVCNNVDDNCADGVDEGFDKNWYRDGDNDTYGRNEAATVNCVSPGANYVKRTGDCDDAIAAVNPGATELCNNRDDNCVGGADELFTNKGMACTDGNTCAGVYECNAAQTTTFCKAPDRIPYYVDRDLDGQGAEGSTAVLACVEAPIPNGTVVNATDCDDADADTYVGATESCDAVDTNCDGRLDDALACNGALRRVTDAATSNHFWRRVATGPSGYPVWIAGHGGKLIRRESADADFEDLSYVSGANPRCGDYDWFAAWVRPSDGHVLLAGENGRVAEHTGTACINISDAEGTDSVSAMVGFESGGVTTLYMVTAGGRLHTWVPGSSPIERQDTGPAGNRYYSIGARDQNLLLVGGRINGIPGQQFITAYAAGSLGTNTPHNLSNAVASHVTGIKVWAPNQAYAVGEGTAIWRWDGVDDWSLVTPPQGAAANFTGLAMPVADVDLMYIVGKESSGRFLRRTQWGWARAPALTPRNGEATTIDAVLHDIAMTSESEFWMVGENGRVYHYPEQ
ncbi:MopE-related protein [Pyxidicoccus sp. 3LG]